MIKSQRILSHMSPQEFEKNPPVSISMAAAMLGNCRTRILQLLDSGKLIAVSWNGQTFVSVASIKKRKCWLSRRAQKSIQS